MDALARGDRQPGGGADAPQTGRVVGGHRLLDPLGLVGLERPRRPDRGGRGEAAVHLHHDGDVRADLVADRGDDLGREAELARVDLGGGGAERVDLQAPVAALDHLAGQAGERLRVTPALVPAVGVGGDAVAEAAAEQAPHRLAERLAHQVVAGDIEGGQGRLGDLAGAAVLRPVEAPGEPLDVERVHADHVAPGHLLDAGEQRVGLGDHAGLADAPEPLVGDQLDEGQLAPGRADHHRLDADDLHCSSSP